VRRPHLALTRAGADINVCTIVRGIREPGLVNPFLNSLSNQSLWIRMEGGLSHRDNRELTNYLTK
jgi:hypothetical protein